MSDDCTTYVLRSHSGVSIVMFNGGGRPKRHFYYGNLVVVVKFFPGIVGRGWAVFVALSFTFQSFRLVVSN